MISESTTGEEQLKKAENIALRLLTFRARSQKEIEERLKGQGFSLPIVEEVVSRLTRQGYLDDRAYAEQLGLSLIRNRYWGWARIELALKTRGLAPTLVQQVLSQIKDDYSEEEAALQIVQRRFSHFNFREAPEKEKRRVIQYFQRRGFSWETIARVLKT